MSNLQQCPACAYRENRVIDPNCVICDGHGIMWLGDAALTYYPPETVAATVDLTLEAAARKADTSMGLSDDRWTPLITALLDLREAGILDAECTTLTQAYARHTGAERPAVSMAQEVLQEPLVPLDTVLSAAPKYDYQQGEQPGRRGLPLLSADGHPSHLARVTDPRDPFTDTMADQSRRRRKQHHAKVLSAAAKEIQAHRLPYRGRSRKATGQTELFPASALQEAA